MFVAKLLAALVKNRIPYALVGGYAVAIHGVVRGTVDIDFVTDVSETNLTKVEEALNSLGLVSRIPVRAKELAAFREEYVETRGLTTWSFVNPSNPLEVVDVLIRFELKDFLVETKKSGFGTIKVISLNDLIKMKTEAGRPQDLSDVKALKRVKEGL